MKTFVISFGERHQGGIPIGLASNLRAAKRVALRHLRKDQAYSRADLKWVNCKEVKTISAYHPNGGSDEYTVVSFKQIWEE